MFKNKGLTALFWSGVAALSYSMYMKDKKGDAPQRFRTLEPLQDKMRP